MSMTRELSLSVADVERLWRNVDVGSKDDCWPWRLKLSPQGYARIRANRQSIYVHRISFALANGSISEGMVIDHLCHNRACANPQHLRQTSIQKNVENRASATVRSKTGVRGVSWSTSAGKYRAVVFKGGKYNLAGFFDRIEDADSAARALRAELFS